MRARAAALYAKLRRNVVGNVYRRYRSGGFLYENYDSETGEGTGTRPFTGWSTLAMLAMAEIY